MNSDFHDSDLANYYVQQSNAIDNVEFYNLTVGEIANKENETSINAEIIPKEIDTEFLFENDDVQIDEIDNNSFDSSLIDIDDIEDIDEYYFVKFDIGLDSKFSEEEIADKLINKLSESFIIGSSEYRLLHEIFTEEQYKQTYDAVSRLLCLGFNPSTITVAHQIKKIWKENIHYHNKYQFSSNTFIPVRSVLSWNYSIFIALMFNGEPDISELELFFDIFYERWVNTAAYKSYMHFSDYVLAVSVNYDSRDFVSPNALFEDMAYYNEYGDI